MPRPADEPVYRTTYEDDVCFAVIEAVATVSDRSSHEIGPLSGVIDPEALEELFGPTPDGRPRPGGTICFPLDDRRVVVDGDRREVAIYD